ncbi:hypothetical protein Fot_37610 [Forsythia ovata]|uniref:Uncharacterized protein n=1 Tax=Forsythia ovata TaxID=205694 RepID=A0ABD1S1M9_9LAMI
MSIGRGDNGATNTSYCDHVAESPRVRSVVDSRVDWLESLKERDCAGYTTAEGTKAIALCGGIVVISEYCKGNSSAFEYLLGLKLIELHIEDVNFATDQTEHHFEAGNTGYESYDSAAKRRLLVSLELFLRIYYKGGMLGEKLASQPLSSFHPNRWQPMG